MFTSHSPHTLNHNSHSLSILYPYTHNYLHIYTIYLINGYRTNKITFYEAYNATPHYLTRPFSYPALVIQNTYRTTKYPKPLILPPSYFAFSLSLFQNV